MKVLQIIECAYRATLEEQDDTIVWITHAMKGAGGDLDVLLRGNAVNYCLKGQDASGIAFGNWQQTNPPKLAEAVGGLVGKGVKVYYVSEDAEDRGIDQGALIDGIQALGRGDIAGLMGGYDNVWYW